MKKRPACSPCRELIKIEVVNPKQQPASATSNQRTPDELEKALWDDMGYVILQTYAGLRIFHSIIVPVLKKSGVNNKLILAHNNAAIESQLMFLRKLNEFFKPLPAKRKDKPLKDDDLRAAHFSDFPTPGAFLSGDDEEEIHKRVGHITLIEVRSTKKIWDKLINNALPIALDRLLTFFAFLLGDAYQPPLSKGTRKQVEFYIRHLQRVKQSGAFATPDTGGGKADSRR